VVIGVGNYPENIKGLNSPRFDADNVREFLMMLGFDVKTLLDEDATREGIWNTLNIHLLENPNIGPRDPVVIYFAGHGTIYPAGRFTGKYSERGYVEAILPVDRGLQKDGEIIPDIYDFELRNFLRRLNMERTKNITLIFDCCHSQSMSRGLEDSQSADKKGRGKCNSHSHRGDSRVRSMSPITDIPPKIKALYLSERDSLLKSKAETWTHVMLAACRDNEFAWEDRNEGMFTKLLLCQFEELPILNTSYEDLEKRLDGLPRQHPVIYGSPELKGSLLFQIGASS
jgi:Caspase domain